MRHPEDFREAVRGGARSGRDAIVVHLAPGDGNAKVGFVVSRGVGNAVTRNLVKRRLRAIVSHHLDAIPAGARLVVRAHPTAARTEYVELERQLGSALNRALDRVAASR